MLSTAVKVLATPAVRRLCREMSIDLSVEPISGTGPGGRVLKGDVLAYAAKETATSHGTAHSSMAAVAEEGAGQDDLSALRGLAQAPAMVFHDGAGRPGSLSKTASASASETLSRPARDWSSESSWVGSRAATTTDSSSAEEVTAVGVQVVVEEEQWTSTEKEAKRPPGVRARKEPVPVPIKGDGITLVVAGGKG